MPDSGISKLCRHFGSCGGCVLQNISDREYRAKKRHRVIEALAREGLRNTNIEDVLEVPAGTRRRAVFKAKRSAGETLIGFHAARAHNIVDMHECLVLTPSLFGLVAGLRETMTAVLREGQDAELHVTEADNGFDIVLRWRRKIDPSVITAFAHAAPKLGIVRVTAGKDVLAVFGAPVVNLGGATVGLPPGAFLQATKEGEKALQTRVRDVVAGAKTIADLFAGCGTFALPLAANARVHAVEFDRTMLAALAGAARGASGLKPITTEARDLFKQPLAAQELAGFDAVVLDPPRAGARAQAAALAAANVRRLAYVSCDPDSFARDARLLVEGGYLVRSILPVDQFLWSEHIELVAAFEKPRGRGK